MFENNDQRAVESKPPDGNSISNDDFIAELKRGIETTRLPPELRAELLANLLPPEEMERLYREMIEEGGLSSEEFLTSLGLEVESQQ